MLRGRGALGPPGTSPGAGVDEGVVHIRLRNMATIYIQSGDEMLLIRRVGSRLFKGAIWSGVGGHFELPEAGDPLRCVLRELHEETGLGEQDVSGLALRYITLRKAGDEIRQQYIFFAHLREGVPCRIPNSCCEGDLRWVRTGDLFDRRMSLTNESCLRHYLNRGSRDRSIHVGAVAVRDGRPVLDWVAVEDFSEEQ